MIGPEYPCWARPACPWPIACDGATVCLVKWDARQQDESEETP